MNSNSRQHVVVLAMAVWPLLNAVAGEWIRINQLGYLPKATKVAVLMCEEESAVKTFEIRIADDRDHVAMKLPNYDPADYGWGKNAERPVYFVDGKPQQRGKFKNATMGADSARHYQWYPFMNMGHYQIAKLSDNQRLKDEFIRNLITGIERTYERGRNHPFLWGVPGVWCSNNLTTAMLTQCILYRQLTGDRTYEEMEGALRDWLLGCHK